MRNTKKFIAMLLALVMVLALAACGNGDEGKKDNTGGKGDGNKDEKVIAVLLYDGTDTYMGTVREAMQKLDEEDDSIKFEFHDGKFDVATQTDQLNNVISQKVDGIVVNTVDIASAPTFMDTLEDSGIPYMFINRDVSEFFKGTDKTIFVGTNAPEAGVMQGEMFLDYMKNNKDWDRNGDGKVQYAVLHGGLDNAEAIARTEYAVKTVKDAGYEMEELDVQVASWDTSKAKTVTDAWLQRFPDDIDVIFSNNDTMALGAVTALEQAGYNTGEDGAKYIPVYGVDAVDEALASIEAKKLTGTVKQDNVGMAEATTALIKNRIAGKDWLEGTDYKLFEDENKNSVRIPYEKVN